MKPIQAKERSIRDLLANKRYTIDYYQREYKWREEQVRELLRDLLTRFDDDYEDGQDRSAVEQYGRYFLGSIILSQRENDTYIVDGQQRLTTLTLVLIYLSHKLEGDDRSDVQQLIYSSRFGRRDFNLHVEERTPVMEALYGGTNYEPNGASESVNNMLARYREIEQIIDEGLEPQAVPYFANWLIENVFLVEIVAVSEDDGYTIFETMNDRGLSLSPLDMLKGYLLANIGDPTKRTEADKTWRREVAALVEFGKDEDSDGFKSWLRSQYADTIREKVKNAVPGDFDRIGTEFHRWVRDNAPRIGLKRSTDFDNFVQREMRFYIRRQLRLRQVSVTLTAGLESIRYVNRYDFTLQYPMLLAPLTPDDDEQTIIRKWRVTSAYIDILLARRTWNFKMTSYSYMQGPMFTLIKAIRRRSVSELVEIFQTQLKADGYEFSAQRLWLHQTNRFVVHQILARLTEHVERESGRPSHYLEYIAGGPNRYEVEHVLANHPERHMDEFPTPDSFWRGRNSLGGLLLLPKRFNASYGDKPYAEKLDHYLRQNILAQSLHPLSYTNDPGFLAYVNRSGLPFRSMTEFGKVEIEERQNLYTRIAEEVWDPARLEREAAS